MQHMRNFDRQGVLSVRFYVGVECKHVVGCLPIN
jgi:hypothetical protein